MDSGMRKNSKKVTTGCRQPCDILHHWSGKGYLSSYQLTDVIPNRFVRSFTEIILSYSSKSRRFSYH
jgi:hypothetical protein